MFDPNSSDVEYLPKDSISPRSLSPSMSMTADAAKRQKPIDQAVSNAFSETAANSVPPELIQQITQNVIKQLQNTALDGSTPMPAQQSQFPPPPPPPPHHAPSQVFEQPPAPVSPSTSNSNTSPNMPNRVFTPPSPQKQSDYLDPISPPTHVPEPSMSPSKGHRASHFSPNRPSSPMSQTSNTSEGHGERISRPKGPVRLHTGLEETTLEKYWGPLFDEDSRPTPRLGQVLRGLAVHIVSKL